MSVVATAKGVRMSPRKVATVASLVRGRDVKDALVILEHTPRSAADAVRRVVRSAQANAEHNHGYKPDTLRIVEITVNSGPRMKRFRPIARGSANRFQHKTSHIRVVVDGDKREIKKAVKSETVAKKPATKEEK